MALLPLLLALCSPAHAAEPQAAELEWRAALGTQIDADSHGMADAGLRGREWSIELLTETLDLRWTPTSDRGRGWLAARAEAGAAGMFISPWTAGAPDPGRALLSHSVGVEGGALRYLPHGFYVGAQGGLRYQLFGATADTTVPVPEGRPVGMADLLLGWWSPEASAWVRAGADGWREPDDQDRPQLAPHVHLEARATAPWVVGPAVELRAGLAQGQDEVTATRLGGLNPYVVPLAGAAWAEWRVEDYAALRLGLRGKARVGDGGEVTVMPFADAAVAAGLPGSELHSTHPGDPWSLGFGLAGGWRQGRSHLDAALGNAPWIERAPGVGRTSLFLRVAVDWGSGTRLWRPEEAG